MGGGPGRRAGDPAAVELPGAGRPPEPREGFAIVPGVVAQQGTNTIHLSHTRQTAVLAVEAPARPAAPGPKLLGLASGSRATWKLPSLGVGLLGDLGPAAYAPGRVGLETSTTTGGPAVAGLAPLVAGALAAEHDQAVPFTVRSGFLPSFLPSIRRVCCEVKKSGHSDPSRRLSFAGRGSPQGRIAIGDPWGLSDGVVGGATLSMQSLSPALLAASSCAGRGSLPALGPALPTERRRVHGSGNRSQSRAIGGRCGSEWRNSGPVRTTTEN